MFTSLLLLVLLVAGFILAAWVTNAVFNKFRKKDEEGRFDAIGALFLWSSVFGSYSYLMTNLLR